jgi:hypothetical protein
LCGGGGALRKQHEAREEVVKSESPFFRRLLAMPGLSGFFLLNNPIQGMGIDCEEPRDFLSGIEINGLSDRGVAGIRVARFPMILPGLAGATSNLFVVKHNIS